MHHMKTEYSTIHNDLFYYFLFPCSSTSWSPSNIRNGVIPTGDSALMFGQHNIPIDTSARVTVSRSVHTDPLSINSLNDDAITTTSLTEFTTMDQVLVLPTDIGITTSSSVLQIAMSFVQNAVSAH